jgi:hypothetical protein
MATTIKLKNSVTTTNAPSSLVQGEVAINITDKKVWVGNAATTPIQLLGGGADGNFTNISVSSVATFGAGTVSAPSITTTGDTNTGIFFPAADTIAFTEGGAEAMRIDSSGNVGINTTSAGVKLGVVDTSAGAATFPAIFGNRGTTVGTQVNFGLQTYDSGSAGITNVIGSVTTSASSGAGSADMVFQTTASGTRAERMRIDSSGNLLVGTTNSSLTAGQGFKAIYNSGTDPYVGAVMASTSNSQTSYHLYSTGAGTFRFYVGMGGTISATSATITTISDQRLKENIVDIDVGLDAVMALKPRKFDWKAGKGKDKKGDRGWIAQEFETVFPEMIDTWKDPAPEGEEPYKAVNADLIPVLVKAIQEQQQIINDLKARIETLESK